MKKDFFKDPKIKYPAYEPWISNEDRKIVNETLNQSMLTLGPKLEKFESDFCKYTNSKYAIAVSNCTAALHLSLKALGIKHGDEVIIPDLTFVADTNAILACNAKPVIADINKDDFFLSISNVKKNITKKTKAIIPVHIYGQVCNIDEIVEIAKENNLKPVIIFSQTTMDNAMAFNDLRNKDQKVPKIAYYKLRKSWEEPDLEEGAVINYIGL